MISDYYKTDFTISTRSEAKTDGRLVVTYTPIATVYKCALFQSKSQRTVRFGKQDYIIDYNIYFDPSIAINLGDKVSISGSDYYVVSILDTNNIGHHKKVGITKVWLRQNTHPI